MQVSVFLGLSLDGFLAREDFSLDWLEQVQRDPPEDTGYVDFMASVDVLVMGRHTYDSAASFPEWPYMGKRVIVLSHHTRSPLHGETFRQGALTALLDELQEEDVGRVYLDGGEVVRQALAADRVTDLTLSWLPVVLGRGRPLFGPELSERRWQLQSSRSFPSGLVQATYIRQQEGQGQP